MQTRNRILETSARLTAGRNRLFSSRRLSDAKFLSGCSPSTPPPPPVDDNTQVLDVLEFFFRERLSPGQLNEHLRRVAAYALSEAINASDKMDFVPRPPSGVPSITWLISEAVKMAFRKVLRDGQIYESVRTVVQARLRSEYDLAKMDVEGALSYKARPMNRSGYMRRPKAMDDMPGSAPTNVNQLQLSPQGRSFIERMPGYDPTQEMGIIVSKINELVRVRLEQHHFDSLVSLCCSITINGFVNSTLLTILNAIKAPANDPAAVITPDPGWALAAEEIRKWQLVDGAVDAEMLRRRAAEAELFQSASYGSAIAICQSYVAFARAKSTPRVSKAQNPLAAIVGAGWTVLQAVSANVGDVTYTLVKMDGQKCPRDNEATYKNKDVYKDGQFTVTNGIDNAILDINSMSADFEVRYKYNGYAVGSITMQYLRSQDAVGWGLHVTTEIMVEQNAYLRSDNENMAGIEITFNYRFHTPVPFKDDEVWIGTYKIYGDGRMVPSGRWTT